MMRSLLCAVMLLFFLTSNGFALVYVEKDDLFLYYPDNEGVIAERLLEKYPVMVDFLRRQGLSVAHPVHVVLDDDLDIPKVEVHMIPHREIRIPLRAPGVLEDGYTETDPWSYFLFRGLCLQGIYKTRSGIPGGLHKVFGEVISPNLVMPDWLTDGTCHLLYSLYRGKAPEDPFHAAIFESAELPEIAKTSHHPETWPGFHGYRIYGRPFMNWIYQSYGWERLLEFIRIHGAGIVPIEIDLKAKEVWLRERKRRYSYRFLFSPGVIGSITWLARNRGKVHRVSHGLTLVCLGDRSPLTYKKTLRGDAEIDRAAAHVLAQAGERGEVIDFFPYGYDERQFNSPGFRLPVGSLMRGRHGRFPE